jgi:hypothetical protein
MKALAVTKRTHSRQQEVGELRSGAAAISDGGPVAKVDLVVLAFPLIQEPVDNGMGYFHDLENSHTLRKKQETGTRTGTSQREDVKNPRQALRRPD